MEEGIGGFNGGAEEHFPKGNELKGTGRLCAVRLLKGIWNN